jgi:ribonucleoside-diphosphate reductase alpha chain
MLMRVSVGIHLDDLKSVIETYDLMSKKFFYATPYLMRVQNLKCRVVSIGDAR